MPKIPPHIFVKTLEEAQRLAPNAKLVKDESGSDIPCHPYEVCLCEATDQQIVEHDRKAEITRLIRGDYFWLLLGESPEDTEKREKYGLKKGSTRTSPIEVWYSTRVTEDEFRALFGAPKGQAKPMTPEEMRTSPEPNIRMAFDPEPGLAYPQRHTPHIFPTLDRKMESVHTDVPKAGYLKQPTPGDSPSRSFSDIDLFAFYPGIDVADVRPKLIEMLASNPDIRAKFPLGGWPERPSMAMSGRPLVLRSDDPLAEELKKRHGLGKQSTEASTPDVPPVGAPKERLLDFLRHAAESMDPSLPVDDFYVKALANHMEVLAQTDDESYLRLLKAEQKNPNYLRQAPLPTPEGEDGKNGQRHRFADVGVIADYMRYGGKGDQFYHSHTVHENTKPTEKPSGRMDRLIYSFDSEGGPVQGLKGLLPQSIEPLPELTGPEPEEILVGQVNGQAVWDSVQGDYIKPEHAWAIGVDHGAEPAKESLAVVGQFFPEPGRTISIEVETSDQGVKVTDMIRYVMGLYKPPFRWVSHGDALGRLLDSSGHVVADCEIPDDDWHLAPFKFRILSWGYLKNQKGDTAELQKALLSLCEDAGATKAASGWEAADLLTRFWEQQAPDSK